jgi:hypothetical protein
VSFGTKYCDLKEEKNGRVISFDFDGVYTPRLTSFFVSGDTSRLNAALNFVNERRVSLLSSRLIRVDAVVVVVDVLVILFLMIFTVSKI